jgi:hypothetical protein
VPATEGAAMPAGFMLRNRMRYEFVTAEQVLKLNRNGLAASGLAVATITARAIEPGPGALAGVSVVLDGTAPQDRTPPCDMTANPLCAGQPVFNFYTVEVVQRIGYDSFTPDNGVLIAKNKNAEGQSCGYNCFTWVIDAHPEDINMLDFTRPDGTRVMRTPADYRQLNDALFHAGLRSGSAYEWQDAANRLHFYVIDMRKDDKGILSYSVGVRSLDGAGPQAHGVTASAPATLAVAGSSTLNVTLRNTGAAAPSRTPSPHPAPEAAPYLLSDIYRVSVSVDRPDWSAALQNALVAVKFGESIAVPVHVTRGATATAPAKVTLVAVSESDPTKTATVSTVVSGSTRR